MRSNLTMKITNSDISWLESHFPNLQYEADSQKIVGELDFCAAYDNESGKVIVGDSARTVERFICDVFEIEIFLEILDPNGWPKVYEVGGRHCQIAQKCNVELVDLHFYSDDDACCLGLKWKDNKNLSVEKFLHELVIPFFYRLSYTEKFGIAASRADLWDEYSHGEQGLREHYTEISDFTKLNLGRNDLCPCRSGKKYKQCHWDEVAYLKHHEKRTR